MVWHSRRVRGRLPGAPACGSEWPEGTCYAPPGYMLGATYPTPSPTYPYRPGGTGFLVQHPPIHANFLALRGRFIASPGRFCIAEAPATEWPLDDAPVPWILPEGYRNPKGTVLDFPGGTVRMRKTPPGRDPEPLLLPSLKPLAAWPKMTPMMRMTGDSKR